MNIPHIASKVFREPWAIMPEKFEAILRVVHSKLAGDLTQDSMMEPDDYKGAFESNEPSIVTVPIYGIIGQHLSLIENMCGGCDIDGIRKDLMMHKEDPSVNCVVLDVRSPGGTVTGVPELGKMIREFGEEKQIVAWTDSLCASAGYWLSSQANSVFCTPSSQLGSIGVYCYMLDESKWLEKMGISVNEFTSGKFKTSGAPWKPLTSEEKKMFQDGVDKCFAQFATAVQTTRSVSEEDMQGQVYDGDDAVEKGMADKLYDCMEDMISDLST